MIDMVLDPYPPSVFSVCKFGERVSWWKFLTGKKSREKMKFLSFLFGQKNRYGFANDYNNCFKNAYMMVPDEFWHINSLYVPRLYHFHLSYVARELWVYFDEEQHILFKMTQLF